MIVAMSFSPSPDQQELIPAVELPATLLPFSLANVKQAVADALAVDDTDWLFFTNFDISCLNAVESLNLPVRIHAEPGLLILKMITKVHEAMHGTIMAYILGNLWSMGLLPAIHFTVFGSADYPHRLNQQSTKQADSSIGPAVNNGWPAMIVDAGWSEGLGHLHRDASWWLTSEVPPNDPK
jgi:hypothetical protein